MHDASHGDHGLEDELEPRLTPDRPRRATAEDMLRFEGYLAEILTAMGLDLDTPGTRPTPRRFLAAMFDSTSGYEGDPKLLTYQSGSKRELAAFRTAVLDGTPVPTSGRDGLADIALCEAIVRSFRSGMPIVAPSADREEVPA